MSIYANAYKKGVYALAYKNEIYPSAYKESDPLTAPSGDTLRYAKAPRIASGRTVPCK